MEKQEITTYDKERAFKLTELLLESGYVCMLSREEGLYVIDFVESLNYGNWKTNEDHEADRNYVVFMSTEELEEKYQLLTDCN